MTVGQAVIDTSNVMRDLVVAFEAELSMCDHVAQTAQACFCQL
jgi:hypothetical protein